MLPCPPMTTDAQTTRILTALAAGHTARITLNIGTGFCIGEV